MAKLVINYGIDPIAVVVPIHIAIGADKRYRDTLGEELYFSSPTGWIVAEDNHINGK